VIYFVTYEDFRDRLKVVAERNDSEVLRVYAPLIAGSVSRGENGRRGTT